MDTQPISLLLVDDQVLFREAMRMLLSLEPSLKVVGEASHGEEAVRMVSEHQPQVVLMDLSMPVMTGSEATRRMRIASPGSRVLVLTTFDDEEGVFEVLRSGASGYVLKNTPVAQLVAAIHTVAEGGTYLQPSVATQVVAELNRLSQRPNSEVLRRVMSLLSTREMDILRHLTRGMSNKEIAAALNITEGTVKNHMTSIFDKLEVPDRTSAALKARELQLG